MTLILVGQYDSPFVRRVAVSLQLSGMAYQHAPLSVFGDAAAMRRLNPLGRVPALLLGGDPENDEVLVDSAAILDWLDGEVGPSRALLPPAGRPRRRQMQLVVLAAGTAEKLAAIAYEDRLRPEQRRWGEWVQRCTLQVQTALDALEMRVASTLGEGPPPWLGGERPGQADITIACMVHYLGLVLPHVRETLAGGSLADHSACAEKLPAFAATRADAYTLPGRR